MKCETFRNAIHMIVDTPMRNVCKGFHNLTKILVTPYVPNPLDMNNPDAYLQLPSVPLRNRTTFVSNHPFLMQLTLVTGPASRILGLPAIAVTCISSCTRSKDQLKISAFLVSVFLEARLNKDLNTDMA